MAFNLSVYLFHEDYIQPEATSTSPRYHLTSYPQVAANKLILSCNTFHIYNVYIIDGDSCST